MSVEVLEENARLGRQPYTVDFAKQLPSRLYDRLSSRLEEIETHFTVFDVTYASDTGNIGVKDKLADI